MATKALDRGRGLFIAAATIVLLLAGFGLAATGYQKDNPALQPLLLSRPDIPYGFAGNPTLSVPLNANTAHAVGFNGSTAEANSLDGWIGIWTRPGLQIRVLIGNVNHPDSAVKAMHVTIASLERRGLEPFGVSSISGAKGEAGSFQVDGNAVDSSAVVFVRGSLEVVVGAATPGQSGWPHNLAVVESLARAQASKIEDQYGGTVGQPTDPATAFGFAVGALVGYLLLLGAWAYFRDPLRGDRRRRRSSRADASVSDTAGVTDVTQDARKLKRAAVVSFAVQLCAVVSIFWAVVPQSTGSRVAFAVVGVGLLIAVSWYRSRWYRPRHATRGTRFWLLTSKRPVRATGLVIFASLAGLIGAFFIVQAARSSGGSPGVNYYLGSGASFLAVAGICLRRARRVSAVSARRSLERDSRPMVLYLRSFGDDTLKLRSATLGRRSLVERFSPNRFDSFEETIVRHLSRIGPVVALNPPGTSLPPLGAARETLQRENWRSVIDEWMGRAELIVIGAPPRDDSPGLAWELDHVADGDRWSQTVVVVPPVPVEELRSRWESFEDATPHWPASSGLAADSADTLAMVRGLDGWTVITATSRSEWSYAAALEKALEKTHELTVSTQAAAPDTVSVD
jgi:hypothetical protein